jgi:hypothetical protein
MLIEGNRMCRLFVVIGCSALANMVALATEHLFATVCMISRLLEGDALLLFATREVGSGDRRGQYWA